MKLSMRRRAFLGSLGATTAAATFLRPILAQAQTGKAPQRLLMIHRPCGSAMNPKQQPGAPSYWWPTSGTPGDKNWVVAPGGLIDSFKDIRDNMVVMKGVHCPRVMNWKGDKHAAGIVAMICPPPADPGASGIAWPVLDGKSTSDSEGKWFTGTDRSIDQWLLANIPTLKSPFELNSPTLTPDLISAQKDNFCVRVVSYKKDDRNARFPTQITPQANPAIAFQDLFGAVMSSTDNSNKTQDQSVIDFINGDLKSMRPRLPKLAREKVDVHLASIRQLELQLSAMGSSRQCTPPTLAPLNSTIPGGTAMDGSTDAGNDARYHQAALQQLQVIKTAFQCDLIRVANFTFGWGNCGIVFKKVLPQLFPGTQIDDDKGYHAVSHNGGTNPAVAQYWIDKYFCTMTANFLKELANTPDGVGGGSLLENTLVVFWNECSVGDGHWTNDMPVLLFGGKFLNLMQGRYFDFSSKSGGTGRYMSDFWVELSKRWGTADGVAGTGYTPLSKYGADRWNLGDMAELFG